MPTLNQFINHLKRLKTVIPKEGDKIFMGYSESIKSQNIERMRNKGLDANGVPLGIYTDVTVAQRELDRKPIPGDRHIMLYYDGDFQSGIELKKKELSTFEITSTDEKWQDGTLDRWLDALGLTTEDAARYEQLLTDQLRRATYNLLNVGTV